MIHLPRLLLAVLLCATVLIPVFADDAPPPPGPQAATPAQIEIHPSPDDPNLLRIKVKNAPAVQVLSMIVHAGGINVLLAAGVTGTIAELSLTDVTAEQAIPLVVAAAGLACRKEGDHYLVDVPGGPLMTWGNKPKVQISLLYLRLAPGVAFVPPHNDTAAPNASLPAPGGQTRSWEPYLRGLLADRKAQVINEPRITTEADLPASVSFGWPPSLQTTTGVAVAAPPPGGPKAEGGTCVTAHIQPDQSVTLKMEFIRGGIPGPRGDFEPPFEYYAQSTVNLRAADYAVVRGLPGMVLADGRTAEVVVIVTAKVLPAEAAPAY